MSRGRRKCQFCPSHGPLSLIERGYTKEQVWVCDDCLEDVLARFRDHPKAHKTVRLLADPRQMQLFRWHD